MEAPQALTCNTNTWVRIDPPRSSNRRRLGGVKKIIGRVEPPTPPPGKSDPVCTLYRVGIIFIYVSSKENCFAFKDAPYCVTDESKMIELRFTNFDVHDDLEEP